jgi:hypothetical protein
MRFLRRRSMRHPGAAGEPPPEPEPPQARPVPEPELQPEREQAPEPAPPPPPEPVHLAPAPELPPEPEELAEEKPEPAPEEPEVVVPLVQRDLTPREWNIWELERIAAETEGTNPQEDEERALLLITLRQFADPSGELPVEFDPLVRDAFGPALAQGLV